MVETKTCTDEQCSCTCHETAVAVEVCPPHLYGDGWYEVENGVRVRYKRVCARCKEMNVEVL